MEEFLKANPTVNKEDIPTDLLTTSGSGLDPEVSPKAAEIQIDSVAKASGVDKGELLKIIQKILREKLLEFLGKIESIF